MCLSAHIRSLLQMPSGGIWRATLEVICREHSVKSTQEIASKDICIFLENMCVLLKISGSAVLVKSAARNELTAEHKGEEWKFLQGPHIHIIGLPARPINSPSWSKLIKNWTYSCLMTPFFQIHWRWNLRKSSVFFLRPGWHGRYIVLVGGWTNPSAKICSLNWIIFPRGENF